MTDDLKACHCCQGTGKELDHREVGLKMRELRKKYRLSLRSLGRRLRLSAPYLSDLELGNRKWNDMLIAAYRRHCK